MLLTWILSAGIVVTTLMTATYAIGGPPPLAVASFVPINPMARAYDLLFIAVLAFILVAAEATASKPISASRNGRTGWRRRRERAPYGKRVRQEVAPLHSSGRPYRIACSFSSKRCICALSGVA
ncbi:hypothetical protein GGE12_000362 [Rhizobium mongolense]|uniref:Uncharacterized protein n=1 Tax=Rhizobium mongolense TaxID=57676 RepID=A0A7W6RHM7_9HYPH|nr:hypothetical protein [Rhizobium mongolense]